MQLRVSSPGNRTTDSDVDRIAKDLQKIDRRLQNFQEVYTDVRLTGGNDSKPHHATLEVQYGKNHLVAKAEHQDMGQAIRAAREEILRQINDRSRGSHSQYAKGR